MSSLFGWLLSLVKSPQAKIMWAVEHWILTLLGLIVLIIII